MQNQLSGGRPRGAGARSSCFAAQSLRRGRARAAILFAASACASLAVSHSASGQTWVNPNTGSWSVGTNWTGGAAPASSTSTKLRFNATGAQTYAANNNIATPFSLNSIDLNNTGTGTITLNGNSLSFGGTTPAINTLGSGYSIVSNALVLAANTTLGGAGTGTTTLSGALSSSPAATGTAGNSLITSSSANYVLSGGGTLYSIRANVGNTFITGGTYTLTSTQHGTDTFGGVTDAGNWSLLVGDTSGQVGNFTQTGGTINGQNLFVGNAGGAFGNATFSGATTVVALPTALSNTNGLIGTNFGTGSINVLAGASLTGRRLDLARQNNGVGNLLVSGTNSKITLSQEFDVGSGLNSTGRATISSGGQVTMAAGQAFIGSASDTIGNPITTNGTVTVTGANSLLNVGGDGSFGSGQLMIGFGSSTAFSQGTLSVLAGGRVNSNDIFAGEGNGSGNIIIDGANSQLVNGNQLVLESAAGNNARLEISNGGLLTNNGNAFFAQNANDKAIININNGTANINGPFSVTVLSGGGGFGASGGSTTLTIGAGGTLRTPVLFGADAIGSKTHITVNGPGAQLVTDQLVMANDANAVGTINVSGGGKVVATTATSLSTHTSGLTYMTFTGAGTSYDGSTAGSQLHVGGSGGTTGGSATFSVANGATAKVSSLTQVYAPGRLIVGEFDFNPSSVGTLVTGQMNVSGRVLYNVGTLNVGGALAVNPGGQVLLNFAIPGSTKTLEVGSATITGAGTIDLADNSMIAHSTTLLAIQNLVKNAYNFGNWDQPGITSFTAAKGPGNTTLGVMTGADFNNNNGGTFYGRTVAASDVLVKYTYFGDVDFNGQIDASDYNLIDFGFVNHLTGWANGDADYSGSVDVSDYNLIDFAFSTQSGVLTRSIRIAESMQSGGDTSWIDPTGLSDAERTVWLHAQSFGPAYVNGFLKIAQASVPEPASMIAVAGMVCGVGLMRRRARR